VSAEIVLRLTLMLSRAAFKAISIVALKLQEAGASLCRLRIRQRPDELAYRLLLLLAPNLSKIASDLEQHPLVRYDLARTFPTKTFVKIGERHAQRAGNLK